MGGALASRDSGRRLRLAQERMAAAVQAAEADRSETYSGRSTEDTEVRALRNCPLHPVQYRLFKVAEADRSEMYSGRSTEDTEVSPSR